ncbi:M48 family metallopeptidase [Sporolactobacillus pectinivorans]|uniref:M48 family metallopeptidase n=1 Tax=Sporolactobacillus pectinivorans TaxID=1591408 RepID=UPI001EFC4B7D|nr:M48 family metallopeptidase [Sporolactobacillus pectinivorans]
MKKIGWGFTSVYGVYLAFMAAYFFIWAKAGVPPNAKGTPADPSLFMNAHQLAESARYNAWRHFISFAAIPLEWGVYLFVLISGFSRGLRNCSERLSRLFIVQMFFCFAVVSLVSAAAFLPVNFITYRMSVHYGISVQSIQGWLRDQEISFAIDSLIGFITLAAVFFFIRRNPRNWWLPVWLLAVPFIVFMMYLQPVVIDPLYNHFQSLQNGQLKQEILGLATRAGIPANNVYEVDMSKQTHAMNAYVTGVGSNLRIVLWDTTVHQLSRPQVLFIMAHEMGHYVMHHILWGMVLALAGLLIGLFLAAKLLVWIVERWGARLNLSHPGDLAALPLVLLLFATLSFAGEPVQNAISRQFEHSADSYAIHMTKNRTAAISSFQKLSAASLGEINPPALVKWVQYDHPTMLERINYFEHVNLKK